MENHPFNGPVDIATFYAFARYAADMRKRATHGSPDTPQGDLVVWFGIGRVRLFSGAAELARRTLRPSWPFSWALRLSAKPGESSPAFSCTELERMLHVFRYSYATAASGYSELVAWLREVDKLCADRFFAASDPKGPPSEAREPRPKLFDEGPTLEVYHEPYKGFSDPVKIYAKPYVVGLVGHVSLDFGIDIVEKCFSDACEPAAAWLAHELTDAIPVYLGEGPPTQPWERVEKANPSITEDSL